MCFLNSYCILFGVVVVCNPRAIVDRGPHLGCGLFGSHGAAVGAAPADLDPMAALAGR